MSRDVLDKREIDRRGDVRYGRLTKVLIFLFFVTTPFLALRYGFDKDYEGKNEIFRKYIGSSTWSYSDGSTLKIPNNSWHFIGMSDTDTRVSWARGGYLINFYAMAYVKERGEYAIAVMSIDDNATGFVTGPEDVQIKKGFCRRTLWINEWAIKKAIKYKSSSIWSDGLNSDFCKATNSEFMNMSRTWESGTLNYVRGLEAVLKDGNPD